ncbi:MAG TPA: Ig-like domain-containing protein, partial [Verrucomicrobiae bacterium]|nr:Ig-like domain-containing protein [Verrucomicrobiae bacterium]
MKTLLALPCRLILPAVCSAFLALLPLTGHAQSSGIISVDIASPTNGAQFVAPTNVLFDVSVDDPTGETGYVSLVATPSGSGVLPDFALFLGSVSNFISLDPPIRIYMFDWSNAIPGTWTINAAAYRTNGVNVGSANVQITVATTNVSSTPFSVDIASPTNGASFPGPTNIELIAGVVVSNDTVASVEFLDGSNIIGIATNWVEVDPPGSAGLPAGSHAFTLDWTNETPGIHSLTAVATDTNGITVTSAPTEITIGNATPPPVVQITEPISGSVFTTPVNITIDASVYEPARDVAYVSFFASETFSNNNVIATVLLGNVTNFIYDPPYQLYSVIWSNAPPGQWSIEATAVRSNGTTADSAPVRITVEKGPPYSLLVNITQPTNSTFYPEPTNIEMIAETVVSNDVVASVTFYNGPYEIGVVTNWVVVDPVGSPGPPVEAHAYFLNWSNDLPGVHILTAVATDLNGNTVTSPPVVVTIGNAIPPPTPVVTITAPTNGQRFTTLSTISMTASVPISATLYDPGTNVAYLNFSATRQGPTPTLTLEIGSDSVGGASNGVYTLDWSNATPGTWLITAQAVPWGEVPSSSSSVEIVVATVTNILPVVRITSPANNTMFRAPVNVALLAYASEPNGTVGSVEFFAGSNALGFGQPVRSPFPVPLTPETPPDNVPVRFVTNTYELIWSNAPAGSYAITALATDTNGDMATSAPVNITILPPIIP